MGGTKFRLKIAVRWVAPNFGTLTGRWGTSRIGDSEWGQVEADRLLMSWKFQAIRYLWQPSSGETPQFSLEFPDVLHGGQGWLGADGRAIPVLQLFALQGRLKAGSLSWDAGDLEHHVRGQDLILEYPYSDSTPTGVECYWRPEELVGGGLAVQWLVSANTRLLDENIQWSVVSEFQAASCAVGSTDETGGCAEFFGLKDGHSAWDSTPSTWDSPLAGQKVLLIKLVDDAGWVALAAAPGDQRQLRVDLVPGKGDSLRASVRYELQMGFLEKGVIRRARLWCIWLPMSENAPALMERHLQDLYRSPQPLTV
jgi:hypothetical protein